MATLNSKNLFIGFSTVDSVGSQQLVDIKIVNQDLLNIFNTRPNERLMMPGYGFGGWDYLFEPIDQVRDLIIAQAEQVVASDPRVQLQNIDVVQEENGLSIQMSLYYVPWQVYGTFQANFDTRSAAMV